MTVRTLAVIVTLPLIFVSLSLGEQAEGKKRPIRLSLAAPTPTGPQGALQNTRWPLTFRLSITNAPALVEAADEASRREAVVVRDPDDCIDMRDFPNENPGIPYEACAGPDERYVEFASERFDSHDLEDERTGNDLIRQMLVDDPFVEDMLLNKPYLRNRRGEVEPVSRPQTGGERPDGYGYGVDDDLPGLVIMANIGGARVFDADFNRAHDVIRNLGGFVNTVSVELLSRNNTTTITASMHVLAGLFEPIALFDLDVDDPDVDFLRRLESGAVEPFRFETPPEDEDALLETLVGSYSPVEFTLRAVIVEGVGPTFIEDVDRDGEYTAHDVELMGYELLSNPVTLPLRLVFDLDITDTVEGRTCPPRTLVYGDLDANGRDGRVSCSGSGGALRIRRRPR